MQKEIDPELNDNKIFDSISKEYNNLRKLNVNEIFLTEYFNVIISHPVVIFEESGKIIFTNSSVRRFTNYNEAELNTKNAHELIQIEGAVPPNKLNGFSSDFFNATIHGNQNEDTKVIISKKKEH